MIRMMFRNHVLGVIPILLLFFSPGFPMPYVLGAESAPNPIAISLNAENESLSSVLGKISRASGYKIDFDSKWGNHPVNIQLKDEPLEEALNRVLANLNHALIWDDTEKKISIFINGEITAGGARTAPSFSGPNPIPQASDGQRSPPAGRPAPQPSRVTGEVQGSTPSASARGSRPPTSQSSGDLPVSVSGENTRFGQGTSTIE